MKKQFNNNSGASLSSNIEAKEFLGKMGIDYTENTKTGEITVDGNLNISYRKLKKLPNLTMVIVKGDFLCSDNQLTSLVGSPQSIGGGFYCYANNLTTLEGGPQNVRGSFSCSVNQLISLVGSPQKIGGSFWCRNNQLTTLTGAPQTVGGDFECYNNLKELKYSEPYDQYWIATAEEKSIKQVPDKKTRTQKIADFRCFAKSHRKQNNVKK